MLLACTGHANEAGVAAVNRQRRNKDLAHGAPASGAALERSGALRSAPGLPFCPLSWKQIFEPRPGVNECSYHLRWRPPNWHGMSTLSRRAARQRPTLCVEVEGLQPHA